MTNPNEHFLFPQETLADVFFENGVCFEVVDKAPTIWCGTLGYAPNLDDEPDIENLLQRYQALVPVEKRECVSSSWSGCISIEYWPGGRSPRGIMFMQQVSTAQQDEQYDVYEFPAARYIRVHYNSPEIPRKLLGKEECGVYELFGPIQEAAKKHGYTFRATCEIEIEYYGPTSCYAYCAVEKNV